MRRFRPPILPLWPSIVVVLPVLNSLLLLLPEIPRISLGVLGVIAPSSPGFYSCLFVVQKASGSWRPVIDLSSLNGFVQLTPFRMESNQSVLRSIRSFDWMISIDFKDAYLQVLIHPDSRKFLRFVVDGRVYQFKALCFGLSTAPQVLKRVMALVPSFLHSQGVRMLRYLDDWLILASSHLEALEARDKVL